MKIKKKLIEIYEKWYELNRIFNLRVRYHLNIMNYKRTIKYILKTKCSIARYGDGEFDHVFNRKGEGYQEMNPELSKKLIGVLTEKNERLLVCIPYCLNSLKDCNNHSREFWIEWGKRNNYHKKIVEFLRNKCGQKYRFGDSQITRPYIDWKSCNRAKYSFLMLKKIWYNREILIIEGEKTRLGIGNDLFNNAKSIKRIIAPANNAFNYLEEIKDNAIQIYKNELIILALGPTATILASEFSKLNMQALDIGHIDIEYEWFLSKATERVAIEGKYTNEAINGEKVDLCNDSNYLDQIILKIGV